MVIHMKMSKQGPLVKQVIGLCAFSAAIGMLLMFFMSSRLMGIVIIALLLFIGYMCCSMD